jgi:hypothetical protein
MRCDDWRVRSAVWIIAGVAALAAVLSGCGQQDTGAYAASSPSWSARTSPASLAHVAASGVPGGSEAGSPATTSGPGGQSRETLSTPGRTAAGIKATVADSDGDADSSSDAGCPTAGVGGDPVPPPCPVAAAPVTSDGIQGPVSPPPATSQGATQGTSCAPTAPRTSPAPSPTVSPSPTDTVSPTPPPSPTDCATA